MKAYTDIEQSRKLSKILPLGSADMHYVRVSFENKQSDWFIKLGRPVKSDDIIPCWSLGVLLNILPYPSLHKTFSGWRCDSYNKEGTSCILGEPSDNQIDTCYKIILTLHNLKML